MARNGVRQGCQKAGKKVAERRRPLQELKNVQNQDPRFAFKAADGKSMRMQKQSFGIEYRTSDGKGFRCPNLDCSRPCPFESKQCEGCGLLCRWDAGTGVVMFKEREKIADVSVHNDMRLNASNKERPRQGLQKAGGRVGERRRPFQELQNVQNRNPRSFEVSDGKLTGKRKQSSEMEGKLVDVSFNSDKLAYELQETHAKLADMEAKYKDLEKGSDTVSADRDFLAHKLEEANSKLADMESECKDLKKENESVSDERDVLAHKLGDANAKLAVMEAKNKDLEKGNEAGLTKLEEVNTKLAFMEAIGKGPKKGGESVTPMEQTRGGAAAKSSAGGRNNLTTLTFPEVLYGVISDVTKNGYAISWLSHGQGFVICDKVSFASEILPLHFGCAKWPSFARRLRRWDFECVPSGPEMGAYYHRSFLRGRPDLVGSMAPEGPKLDRPLD